MEARVEAILAGEAAELVWLLEHPPLYTAGTSARPADLLWPDRFPVFPAGAAASSPTTARASAWPTRCSTSTAAAATCAPMSGGSRNG